MRRVLVAGHHRLVRGALADLVAGTPGLQLAAVTARADEAIESARTTRPDVVLVDVDSAGFGEGRVADLISEILPEALIIRLSVLGSAVPLDIHEMLRSITAHEFCLEPR
jgi:DNA-binding NarL/FixJ family response regulator